jgi:hypothetical protein
MPDRILLYISAASDLALERETLSKATIEIPTTLAWRIKQTPGPDEKLDSEAVARADVHLLVLGGDIRAPVGAEWLAARRAGRTPTLFLKESVIHTPAATVFVRDLERHTTWRPYDDAADLRRQVLKLLVEHILDRADYYRIGPEEFQKLRSFHKQLEKAAKQSLDQTRGGAGASSVILSPERFTPSTGKLIQPSKSKRAKE